MRDHLFFLYVPSGINWLIDGYNNLSSAYHTFLRKTRKLNIGDLPFKNEYCLNLMPLGQSSDLAEVNRQICSTSLAFEWWKKKKKGAVSLHVIVKT